MTQPDAPPRRWVDGSFTRRPSALTNVGEADDRSPHAPAKEKGDLGKKMEEDKPENEDERARRFQLNSELPITVTYTMLDPQAGMTRTVDVPGGHWIIIGDFKVLAFVHEGRKIWAPWPHVINLSQEMGEISDEELAEFFRKPRASPE